MSHREDIHILLMGNSHIFDGLIPDSMGYGVFNTAVSGRPYIYDNDLIKQYVPLLNNLEAVIVPLDYFSFYLGREYQNPRVLGKQESGNMMNSTHKCMHYKYMNVKADFWYWSELLNSKMNFMSRFVKSAEETRECDSLGFRRNKLSKRKEGWKTGSLPLLINSKKPIVKQKYNILENAYSSMASVTFEKNVRLILVGTPLYKTYHEDINKDVVIEIKEFAKKLQKKYPNVEYYDYTFDPRFKDDDFYDAGHLSEFGAAKFSKIMKGIIENHAQ